jgi:hypothetical protein
MDIACGENTFNICPGVIMQYYVSLFIQVNLSLENSRIWFMAYGYKNATCL